MSYCREIPIDPVGTDGRRSVMVVAIPEFKQAELILQCEGDWRRPYMPLTADQLDELADSLKNAAFALRIAARKEQAA